MSSRRLTRQKRKVAMHINEVSTCQASFREHIMDEMYSENVDLDKKRQQSYIV